MGSKRINPEEAGRIFVAAGVQPLEEFQTSKTPWRSKCLTCNREVQPTYSNVKNGHSACKFCAGLAKDPTEAENVLLRALARPLAPYPGSKVPWRCVCMLCDREIAPTLRVVAKAILACNFCKGLSTDARDAVTLMLENDLNPLDDFKSVHARWRSECLRCNRITFPSLHKVRIRGHQCGWCSRSRLDSEEAKQILISAGANPIGPYPGANNPWPALCDKCEKRITPKVSVVASGVGACVYCAKHKVDPVEATELMQKHGVEPLVPYPGARNPWKSTCHTCLRVVEPQYANVSTGHAPCVYCAKRRVDPQTAAEFAVSRALEPLEPFPGAVIPWALRCLKCRGDTSTTWAAMNQKKENAGCSSCTAYGFKPNEPSYFYVITHSVLQAAKIGISNIGSGRISKHRKNGWDVNSLLVFESGKTAHDIEQKTLRYLRQEIKLQPAFLTGDGWTETFLLAEVGPTTLLSIATSLCSSEYIIRDGNSVSTKD